MSDKVAVYAQVDEEVRRGIIEASGIRGGRGEIVWGLSKLYEFWKQHGKPAIIIKDEVKDDAG